MTKSNEVRSVKYTQLTESLIQSDPKFTLKVYRGGLAMTIKKDFASGSSSEAFASMWKK